MTADIEGKTEAAGTSGSQGRASSRTKLMAVAIVAVLAVAAISAVLLVEDNEGGESIVTLTMRECHAGDNLVMKIADGSTITLDITNVEDGRCDYNETYELDGEKSTTYDKFTLVSELSEYYSPSYELSEMTKLDGTTLSTKYGKVYVEVYEYIDSDGDSFKYYVIPGTTTYLKKVETDSIGTSVTYVIETTMLLVDGKEQKA